MSALLPRRVLRICQLYHIILNHASRIDARTVGFFHAVGYTYRQCIGRQVEHMVRCILGREEAYSPLLIK